MNPDDQPPAPARRRDPATRIAVLVTMIGLAAAAYPLTLPSMLAGAHGFGNGAGYDDGAYLGMAVRLVHGSLPYRDFGFVHPPGIALLMAPFAALDGLIGTRDVLVLTRLATVVVAGLNCGLVAVAVRHRGWVASLCAGLLLAGFPGAYTADHTLLLEPWLVLFCLAAFVLAFPGGQVATTPRRLLLAGLCAGFACTVKVWALLPIIAVVLVVVAVRRRASVPLLVGLVVGGVVPCLPFFLAAPGAFLHEVLGAQLSRSTSGTRLDTGTRLGILSGLKHFGEAASGKPVVAIAVVLAVLVIVGLVLARRRLVAAEPAIFAATALSLLGLFVPVQLYDHYAYFTAPFAAMLLGSCAGLAAEAARRFTRGRPTSPWAGRIGVGVPAALAALVVLVVGLEVPHGIGRARSYFTEAGDPAATVSRLVRPGACVVTDDPVLLLTAGRFDASRADCPKVVDPFGLWLVEADGVLPHLGGPFPEAFVDKWSEWFGQADYVVLSVPGSSYIPFSPRLMAQFNNQFTAIGSADHAYVYQRNPYG